MVYTFSVEGGPLLFVFEVEADSRVEALETARLSLGNGYVDVSIVTPVRARKLRAVCLRFDSAALSDENIVDEWAGVTSCRPVLGVGVRR